MLRTWNTLPFFCLVLVLTSAVGADPGPATSRTTLPLPPLAPFAAAPQPWPSTMLRVEPGRWYLPPAVIGREARPAEAARQQAIRLRPSADRPLLAGPAGPPLAAPYLVPAGSLAYAASPDVTRLTPPWRNVTPDPSRPETASDPALEAARRRLLAALPELRQKPGPFLRLTIPNPQETLTEVRFAKPQPDADAPVSDNRLPPRPTLPVQPAEQK